MHHPWADVVDVFARRERSMELPTSWCGVVGQVAVEWLFTHGPLRAGVTLPIEPL